MLKTYTFLITILYSIALATVCLVKINGLNEIKISYGDKIFHFFAYVGLTVLWYSTFIQKFKITKTRALFFAVVLSIIFGIIIEILQESTTTYRAFEINDVYANTISILITAAIIKIKNKYLLK